MKNRLKKMDFPLLIAVMIFLIFGLIMIFSASNVSAVLRYGVETMYFFKRQLFFIGVGLGAGLIFIINIPTKKYRLLGTLYFIASFIALFLLIIYGKVAGGAQSWYNFSFTSLNIQPVEFIKTSLIMFLGVYYSIIYKNKNNSPIFQMIPFIITAIIAVLVALQPDLGGAAIICGIVFMLYLTLPDEKKNKSKQIKFVVVGIILFLIVLFYSGAGLFSSYQIKRLEFRNPCTRYTEDTGYQVCNGYIAIHNGGLFGKGLGNSTQKYLYLPEAHTDFIFAIIVEELGAVTGIIVVCDYAFILYRILCIARKTKNIQNQVIAYGCFFYILIHILINLLGVLALIPLTGVPLPFLSYGGSYLINLIAMIFVVERIQIENKTLEQKSKN